MIGQTISHYRITEKLGEGGMGVVYKAEDTKLKRPAALKFLRSDTIEDAEHRERFLREAQAAAILDHPNICTVYEINEQDGQTFLSMAFLEGQTVKAKLRKRPLKLDEAIDLAIQTAQGLQAAHEKGIVHRDIKSSNLIVTPQGHVKILDFGLAQLAERSHLTKTATILGTPAYMSPEQAQRRPTDRRTDIWSLGVVIYEMVAGRLPFEAEREEAVAYSIVHEQPEPLTAQRVDVPVELDRLVGKAMAKEAGERYQHVEDMLVDLRTLRRQLDAGSTGIAAAASAATLTHSQGQPMKIRSGGFEWLKALPWALAFLLLLILSLTYFSEPQSEGRPAVRRFTIAPEASGAGVYSRAAAQSIPPAAAISPDGSTIAYASAERPTRLWLHDLSSGKSRPIVGTEYGHPNELPSDDFFGIRPLWSPTGDTVGFFTSHSLKKFSLIDEGITTLHTLQGSDARYAGGAWSLDGNTIVFAAGASGTRLFAVPASGGEVRTVPVSPRGLMGYPAFVASREPAVIFQSFRDLHVVRISDGETALLIADGRNPVYSPTGHVIFDRAGSTWAVPFSLTTLKPAGEAFLVESGFSPAGVSQDGTLLSVTSQVLTDRFQLTIRNRQGTLIGRVGPPLFGASHPAVSPDGEKVAVAASRQPGVSRDIWIFDVEGQGGLRLTTDPKVENKPIWTRDGGRILFARQSDTDRDVDFFITDAAGGGSMETFLDNDSRLAEPAFSPDGGMFIFQDVPLDGTQFDIRFLELRNAGEQTEPVAWLDSQFNEVHPQFSPNGKYVAYASNESDGRHQIHVRPFPAGSPVWQVSRDGGNSPRWSPDGSELYWWGDGGGFPLMAAKMDFARSNPVGEVEELFSTGRGAFSFLYDVMPDGRFVIIEPIEEEGSQTPQPIYMRVVQNWYEEFRNHGQN